MSVDIYQWPEAVLIDETTEEYEYFEYSPDSETEQSLNGIREIKFNIDALSTFIHPHKSFLYFEWQILRQDNNNPFGSNNNQTANRNFNVSLANDGIMHLFSEMKYSINGQPIEDILNPAISSIMLGMLRYPDDFSKSKGLLQCWFKDSENGGIEEENEGRETRKNLLFRSRENDEERKSFVSFSFCIPLKHIFGFCDDYDKVMSGVNHGLSLFRKGDNTALHSTLTVGDNVNAANNVNNVSGRVKLEKVKWCMPHVKPSLEIYNGLTEKIGKGENVKIGFKSRRVDEKLVDGQNWSWRVAVTSGNETPRFLILGFQRGDKNIQLGVNNMKTANPSVFDHCNVEYIQVKMLGRLYPSQAEILNFPKNQYSKAYNNAAKFRELFDGTPELFSHFGINPIDFKTLYPLFVFDVSNQIPKTISSVVEVVFNVKFHGDPRGNPPEVVTAYALTISDKIFDLKGDGSKMRTYIT